MVAFAIRGFFRGAVVQAMGLLGVAAGLWVAVLVSQWVGAHWQGARPAVVFWVLRWLVALLGGMAVAASFQWIGRRLRDALRAGPVGGLDRAGGVAVGAGLGLVWMTCLVAVALLLPASWGLGAPVARAHLPSPLLRAAARACGVAERYVPECRWLGERFLAAERRIGQQARSS
ncbi:MAG: CvpA family protein [Candidatus Eisenbacteria bacterium]|nr:CvpA family protein [Candidatus Eisenbacteria bacterium]